MWIENVGLIIVLHGIFFSVIEDKYYISSRNLQIKTCLCFRQVQKNYWLTRVIIYRKTNSPTTPESQCRELYTENLLERLQITDPDDQ